MRLLIVLLSLLIPLFIGCSKEPPHYKILFPINSSSQTTHYYEGSRFVSSDAAIPVSVVVLNNPITDKNFADILITAQNNTPSKIEVTSLTVRSKFGPVKMVSKNQYENEVTAGIVFSKPADFEKYVPKMEEYGCAPPGAKDTITEAKLSLEQRKLMHFYKIYQDTKQLNSAFYYGHDYVFRDVWVQFFRIDLPKIPKEMKRLTLLLSVSFSDKTTQKFKLVLQKI